jgi:hypothetical protein
MKFGKFARITPKWGTIQLAKNKSFEYQIEFDKFNDQPFELSLQWTTKRDHAGFDFIFSIYKLFWINLNIHDHRHWNHDENRWEDPGDCHYEEEPWQQPETD